MSKSSKKRRLNIKRVLWKLRHIHGLGRFALGRQGMIYCTKCHSSIYIKENN